MTADRLDQAAPSRHGSRRAGRHPGPVSGVGVVVDRCGRGIGPTRVRAAVRLARRAGAPGTVWMHATGEGARLYSRLGFVHVDDHVVLGERPESPGPT